MNPNLIFGFCGLGFGVYQVLMGFSKVNGATTYLILSVITLIASVAFFVWQKPSFTMSSHQAALVVGASFLNGIAGAALFTILAKVDSSRIGIGLVVMVVIQLVSAVVLTALLSKTFPSLPQAFGVVLAMIAVVLVSR